MNNCNLFYVCSFPTYMYAISLLYMQGHLVSCITIFLCKLPRRPQATYEKGSHTSDCTWPLRSSSGVCVGMYGLYSLYTHFITSKGKKCRKLDIGNFHVFLVIYLVLLVLHKPCYMIILVSLPGHDHVFRAHDKIHHFFAFHETLCNRIIL